VSDIFAEPLSVAYIPGIMTITLGYEADVWPRPIGNYSSAISISDWTQSGRFAVGLDAPAVGSEFQRADCSPTSTLGNGRITISDWVQTGRYVAGMDPVPPLGGPTEPTSAAQAGALKAPGGNEGKSALAKVTTIRLLNRFLPAGQNSTVSIEVEAEGSENAFGFSLMFDPLQVSFVSAEKSDEAGAATLNVNKQQAAVGRLGLVLALPPGRTFVAGKHLLVVLNFTLCGHTSELPPIRFSDQPVAREVVDHNANGVKAVFQDSVGFDSLEDEGFLGAQQILDSLNHPVFGGGFDYWNQKTSLWGTETTCVSRCFIEVLLDPRALR
jgi:hypothetical protein